MKTRIMTVDLENDLRSDRCLSIGRVVPKLLNFFDDHKIKATFFTVANLLDKHESDIKEIIDRGHEIASHSLTHSWMNQSNAEKEIGESKKKFKEFGISVSGFRAPKFITTSNHFELLEKHGYKYDSSFSNYFPGFNITTIGKINSFSFPVLNSGLSYRKLMHPFSKAFPTPKIFYLHPWEFLEKKDLPAGDNLTMKLLRHNAGKKAIKIFKEFIDKENCKWVGCKDYLDR